MNIFIFSFVLLISGDIMAQKQDSIPARSLAEKGAQGDLILGKEILQTGDSPQKKEMLPKKSRHKKKYKYQIKMVGKPGHFIFHRRSID
jgi:hypothetical protein